MGDDDKPWTVPTKRKFSTPPKVKAEIAQKRLLAYAEIWLPNMDLTTEELADRFLERNEGQWKGSRRDLIAVIEAVVAVEEADAMVSPEPVLRFLMSRANLSDAERNHVLDWMHRKQIRSTRPARGTRTKRRAKLAEAEAEVGREYRKREADDHRTVAEIAEEVATAQGIKPKTLKNWLKKHSYRPGS